MIWTEILGPKATLISGATSKLFDGRAAAVSAGIVLSAFASRAGNQELLVVLRRAGEVLVPRIIAVRILRLYAKDRVVSAERRGVRRGGPTPADVRPCYIHRKRAAPIDRLNIRRQSCRRYQPRHSGKERIVVEIPRERGVPNVVHGIE